MAAERWRCTGPHTRTRFDERRTVCGPQLFPVKPPCLFRELTRSQETLQGEFRYVMAGEVALRISWDKPNYMLSTSAEEQEALGGGKSHLKNVRGNRENICAAKKMLLKKRSDARSPPTRTCVTHDGPHTERAINMCSRQEGHTPVNMRGNSLTRPQWFHGFSSALCTSTGNRDELVSPTLGPVLSGIESMVLLDFIDT